MWGGEGNVHYIFFKIKDASLVKGHITHLFFSFSFSFLKMKHHSVVHMQPTLQLTDLLWFLILSYPGQNKDLGIDENILYSFWDIKFVKMEKVWWVARKLNWVLGLGYWVKTKWFWSLANLDSTKESRSERTWGWFGKYLLYCARLFVIQLCVLG